MACASAMPSPSGVAGEDGVGPVLDGGGEMDGIAGLQASLTGGAVVVGVAAAGCPLASVSPGRGPISRAIGATT